MTDQAAPIPETPEIDQIMSRIYRRFKGWSQRGFGPDDVTWCEVKADILDIIAKEGSREALIELEAANEAVCALRSDEAYQALIKCPGMSEALLRLDRARAAARQAAQGERAGLTAEDFAFLERTKELLTGLTPYAVINAERHVPRLITIIDRLTGAKP